MYKDVAFPSGGRTAFQIAELANSERVEVGYASTWEETTQADALSSFSVQWSPHNGRTAFQIAAAADWDKVDG